jgi:hypothetical protein
VRSINIGLIRRQIEEQLIFGYKNLKKSRWGLPLLIIGLCLGLTALNEQWTKANDSSLAGPTKPENLQGIDTFIPSGFVLLPIEIQNLNALDGVIGSFGVVDLYVPGETKPLAHNIKILRSSKNSDQFSVLVPETQSAQLVKASQHPLFAIVQNPKSGATTIPNNDNSSRIIIDN